MITKRCLLMSALASSLLLLGGVVQAQDRPNLIHWAYTDPVSLNVNPLWESYSNNVGFDLGAYARYRYGSSASAFLASNDAYGWRIRYYQSGWRTTGIDMLDVAHWRGQQLYGNRLKNWGCYFTDWGPYGWKGAYIFRLY